MRKFILLCAALFAAMAMSSPAQAASAESVTADLTGPTSYHCTSFTPGALAGTATVSTSTNVAEPGFRDVTVKVATSAATPGLYQVWLADVTVDSYGNPAGCYAKQVGQFRVKPNGLGTFRGVLKGGLYMGLHNVQVITTTAYGQPGYSTAPTSLQVP
jgi:hypothetical protein